jgi:chromosome segregation ATPase
MADETRQLAELRVALVRAEGTIERLEERIDSIKATAERNARDIERIQSDTRKQLDSFDGDLSDSKVHMLEEIKAERDVLKRARSESGIWWKRTSIGWVVSAFAAIAMVAIGALATYLLHR